MALNQPQYTVLNIDLATARTQARLVDVGVEVESFIPLDIPAGSGLLVRFGNNGQDIPVELLPSLEICPAAGTGLFFTNPLGGGVAVILIGFKSVQAT